MSAVPAASHSSTPDRIKRRRWYLAAVLSLFWPGLGQLYNGQPKRAIAFYIGYVALIAAMVALSHRIGQSFGAFLGLFTLVVLFFVLVLAAILDAGAQAWQVQEIPLRRYNRVWIYLLAPALSLVASQLMPRMGGIVSYNLPAGSMIPTGLVGDHFFAEKEYFQTHALSRGDLALFKLPSNARIDYIKRVVGLPGDTVQMVGGRLHINGVAVRRERIEDGVERIGGILVRVPQYIETLPDGRRYKIREERGDEGALDNTPSLQVPTDHYFVLGDNRDNSFDSRVLTEFGFVPRASFHDRPAFIFWSRDLARIGTRLE